VRLKDREDSSKPGWVIPKPPTPEGLPPFEVSDPKISDELLVRLMAPGVRPENRFADCAPVAEDGSNIVEEQDCLLQWGLHYLERLIKPSLLDSAPDSL